MYIVEKLSAAKIAAAYRLKYKSPKVAESTVLYQLKRNGIQRRDRADHIRKVTPEMVDGWARRYEAGESLKRIAGGNYSAATIMAHLERLGLSRRERVSAQIAAVTKYPRSPFVGDRKMQAYLIGFARGDLNVSLHGRGIRVKTATTHPEMVRLISTLFERYGNVRVMPRLSNLTGYEWSVQVDLDSTFAFLLKYRNKMPPWIHRKPYLLSFVAGFFDAEGSIWLNQTTTFACEISITNTDLELLQLIGRQLKGHGHEFHLSSNKVHTMWRLTMWRRREVVSFLDSVELKHPEKVAKKAIAIALDKVQTAADYSRLVEEWEDLVTRIRAERDGYVKLAKARLKERAGG